MDHNRNRILGDAVLILLDHNLGSSGKRCEEQLSLCKGSADLFLFADYIDHGLAAWCYIHFGTDITHTSDCILDRLDILFFLCKAPVILIYRPA